MGIHIVGPEQFINHINAEPELALNRIVRIPFYPLEDMLRCLVNDYTENTHGAAGQVVTNCRRLLWCSAVRCISWGISWPMLVLIQIGKNNAFLHIRLFIELAAGNCFVDEFQGIFILFRSYKIPCLVQVFQAFRIFHLIPSTA